MISRVADQTSGDPVEQYSQLLNSVTLWDVGVERQVEITGPSGIRVICLRPHAIPEAVATSHVRELFNGFAQRAGTTVAAP